MKIYENVTKVIYECTKTICDICNKEFDFWSRNDDLGIRFTFGYGSELDGRVLTANYCQDCCLNKVVPALKALGRVRQEGYFR